MIKQYRKAENRLCEQVQIECGRRGWRPEDNVFGWIRDQIFHSGRLEETELGKHAIDICEAAGGDTYAAYNRNSVFTTFFEFD